MNAHKGPCSGHMPLMCLCPGLIEAIQDLLEHTYHFDHGAIAGNLDQLANFRGGGTGGSKFETGLFR